MEGVSLLSSSERAEGRQRMGVITEALTKTGGILCTLNISTKCWLC